MNFYFSKNWQRIGFLAGSLALLAVAFRDLVPYEPLPGARAAADRLEGWFFSPTGQSAPLIFFLALCFLYRRTGTLARGLATPGGGRLALLLVAPGAALYAWSLHTQAADLLLLSGVLLTLGGGALLAGRAGFRALFFPATFLLLLIPVPAVFLNHWVYPLQIANAEWSAAILTDWIGIPAIQRGTVVFIGEQAFQVIENCAGLRTISTMVMASLVYAEVSQRSRLQAVLLILAAPLIGLVVNLGRVISLMLNPSGEIVAVHNLQGIVMIVVGVLMLAALDSLLSRWIPTDPDYIGRWSPSPHGPKEAASPGTWREPAALSLLSLLVILSFAIPHWQPPSMRYWPAPYAIPNQIDDWKASPAKTDKKAMGSIAPNHWIDRIYQKSHTQIRLFVATARPTERHTSLLSPRNAAVEATREIEEQEPIGLEGVDSPGSAAVLSGDFERVLSYTWLLGVSNFWTESGRVFLALDRSDWVEPRQAVWIRISTTIDATPESRRRADRELRAFALLLQPWLIDLAAPGAR
ncbi:MAG: exosortase/archaeosortase family protein [Myxococcota bacterium]|nr:exosortase/archaeosortase family protein [Myxococcota bacterium]